MLDVTRCVPVSIPANRWFSALLARSVRSQVVERIPTVPTTGKTFPSSFWPPPSARTYDPR